MNSAAHGSDSDSQLAELFGALEGVSDNSARQTIISEFVARHPELAADLNGLLDTARQLGDVRPGASEPLRQLTPGQELGPFRVQRLIAIGGMGEIYEAEQVGLNRQVVVKVIRRGLVSEAARNRFLQEQKALARLHHTHIVPVYASGEDENLQYFAMPFIAGDTLARIVARAAGLAANSRQPLGTVFELSAGSEIQVPPASPQRQGRLRLSRAYARSVAEALIQAAEAIDHAHHLGVFHRDLKPSNLMVDPEGQCWVIDFGLALIGDEKALLGGTPAYMAPEQHAGKPDSRSDVWSLGATLYELLALRPAFAAETPSAIRDLVCTRDPSSPSNFARGVPTELESICRKAMSKNPAARYASPAEFASDLKNWLTYRPTTAHGNWSVRPVWLWLRRNWRWATPLLVALAAGVGMAVARFHLNQIRIEAAEQREKDTQRRERELRREVLLQKLQRLRLGERVSGWSTEAWELARQAAEIDPEGVQGSAAATLAGLDAKLARRWTDFDAGAVAFDSTSRHVLIGGWDRLPAHRWSVGEAAPAGCGPLGRGPVAFRPDGTPVRLLTPTEERSSLSYWDIGANKQLCEIPVPHPFFPEPEGFALSADGLTCAAILPVSGTRPAQVVAWNLKTGDRVAELQHVASAVALSADGKLLAAGNSDGVVRVWQLPTGEPVMLESAGPKIRSIAFGKSPRRDGPDRPGRGWLLAAGHTGGGVTVWDVASRVLISRCHGGTQDTLVVAFSPDGTMLASGGRYAPLLWDVRTGRRILELNDKSWFYLQHGLAFSPDGQCLVVTGVTHFGSRGGAEVWELQPDRGIQKLRGLSGPIGQLQLSEAGNTVAATSHDWEVAVWNASTGHLCYRSPAPQGRYPNDHAALAVDSRSNRVACQAGRQAKVWESSGQLLREYELPPGLGDALAFHPSGRLVSVRFETRAGDREPEQVVAPGEQHPRVIRVRELPESGPPILLAEFHDLPWHIYKVEITPDAQIAAADGLTARNIDRAKLIVFDPLNARLLWSAPLQKQVFSQFSFNITGTTLWYQTDGVQMIGMRVNPTTGVRVDPDDWGPGPFDPSGRQKITMIDPPPFGFQIVPRGSRPILHLGIDFKAIRPILFSTRGDRILWGQPDGTVMVADLDEVRRRLREIGLGW
ncbi:MAG: serine/threonine-protein kinase [Planctomycetia bacterium]|nr:serine/threonine-protein kinase [Planctomycetia bacterium]